VVGTKLAKTLKSVRNQFRNVDFSRFFDVKYLNSASKVRSDSVS